jgi:hypothetical protein
MTETTNKMIPTEIWSQCGAVKTTGTMFQVGFCIDWGVVIDRDRERKTMWTHRNVRKRRERK